MKTKVKEDVAAAAVVEPTIECDAAGGQKNDRLAMHSSDSETNATTTATTTTCVSSKMQNVTRILINSTNPQRQPNGKYKRKSTCIYEKKRNNTVTNSNAQKKKGRRKKQKEK